MTRFHSADVIRPNVNNRYVWMVNGAEAHIGRTATSRDLKEQIKKIKEDLYIREAVLTEVERAEEEAVAVEAERLFKVANPGKDNWRSLSDAEAGPYMMIAQDRIDKSETYWWKILESALK